MQQLLATPFFGQLRARIYTHRILRLTPLALGCRHLQMDGRTSDSDDTPYPEEENLRTDEEQNLSFYDKAMK